MQMGHELWKPTVSNFENDCDNTVTTWALFDLTVPETKEPQELKSQTKSGARNIFKDSSFRFWCMWGTVEMR